MVKFKRMVFMPVPGSSSDDLNLRSRILESGDIHMARFLHHRHFSARPRTEHMFLASIWILGSVSGIWAYVYTGNSFLPMMRSCLWSSVSIVNLLSVTILPFLISAFAVLLSCPWLIYCVAFAKAFAALFTSMGIMHTFGGAGWLIRALLCFTEAATLPVLYRYWMCCLDRSSGVWHLQSILAAALLFLAGSIDHCLIAPFLADLIIL